MSNNMTSQKPYLLRALYEWITDNELTPYLKVDATAPNTYVPQEFVQNGTIVLNIHHAAVDMLNISNLDIRFNASFNHIPQEISFPVSAVLSIYMAENGEGMTFKKEKHGDVVPPKPRNFDGNTTPPKRGKPNLKLVD